MKKFIMVFAAVVVVCSSLFASTGGPDAFGYRWIDSDELGGPSFEWIDISSGSSAGPSGDDAYTTVSLPAAFEFYGNMFTQITICTNGWVALGSWSTSSLSTDTIPSTNIPQNTIAATHMDMSTGSGRIYYKTYNSTRFVVTYDAVQEYSAATALYSFQMVLDYDRRSVSINYLNVSPVVSTYREGFIGIENSTGTIGLCYGVNTYASSPLHDSLTILFRSDLVVGPPYFNDCYTSLEFETDGPTNDWELGRPLTVGPSIVHSFPYCWATKKEANYSPYSNSILYPPRMNITDVGQPIFDWWQWFETDSGDDGGVVEISTNDGLSWSVVEPEGGYPCPSLGSGSALAGMPAFSGTSDGWEYQSIDLSSYVPEGEVWLRFHFAADGTGELAGWYIDDVGLQESFGVIKGYVNLDYRVNDSGARIEVPEIGAFDYSDSTGYFFIDSVKAGSWTLVCTRDSFVTQNYGAFTIARNETIEVNFLMPPILMSTNFDTTSAGGVASPIDGWQWGQPDTLAPPPYTANSAPYCWGTNLSGNYMNNVSWTLDFVVFLCANNPHMQLYHWYKLAGEYAGNFWDGANVKVTNYYDTLWTVAPAVLVGYDGTVAPHNTFMAGQPCFGGTGYGDSWHREVFRLSDYAMDTVVIRFELASDGAGTARGWYVDDIIIMDVDTTGIGEDVVVWRPDQIKMSVYPNPFNSVTNIEFGIATEGRTTVEILDLNGRLVTTLCQGEYLPGGYYSRRWDGLDSFGRGVPSGIYLARVTCGHVSSSKTLLLVK